MAVLILKNKNKSNRKIAYLNFYSRYNPIPSMIKATPIRIIAKRGCSIENPPRAKEIIPKIIISTEAIFDIPESEMRPTIPPKTSMIPMT